VLALALAGGALAAGCAGSGGGSAAVVRPPVVGTHAFEGLSGDRKDLTLHQVALATPLPDLDERLRDWGFQGAAERQLVGRTADLYRVGSRTVAFAHASGAEAYVQTIARDSASYLGKPVRISAIEDGRRRWTVIDPPSCGCHAEQPWLIAVRAAGRRAVWVEATGPGVDPALLRTVVRRAP
jgi:hypothetical protein